MQANQPIATRFFTPRTPVAVIDAGATAEALLVRVLLESLGATVTLHQPGTPEDFLLVLSQSETTQPYLIVCGHGNDHGIFFGSYGPDIDSSTLRAGYMSPAPVAARVRLPDRIIVSTACMTGSDAWGKAFLSGGAQAYIAPDGYPEGADVPVFLHLLFHQLIVRRAPIETAWRQAAVCATSTRRFVLHTPEVALRLPSQAPKD